MKIFLAFLIVFMAVNSFAYGVKAVKFNGLGSMSEQVALRMVGFEIGEDINDEIINKSVKKLFAQGYFEDIWVDMKDGIITYNFKEKAHISKIELKGWKDNDSEARNNIVQIKVGSLYDEKKIEAAKKRIIEAINQDGKIDSVIEVEKELLDNGSIKLTFIVNEGEEIIIKKLKYSGTSGLKSSSFDSVIANKEREFMGWLWGRNDGKMKVGDLEYDYLRIKDHYMKYGYLDIDVKEPFVKVNFDNYTADMSYQIQEGEVYNVSGITIEQEKHVIDDALVKEQLKLEVGKPFNIETFRQDAQKIKTLIADLSYAFVQVLPDLKKDKDKKLVEVVVKIIPGDKVKIRDVIISGNSRTLDRIIRRELYLGPGDMYSLTDLTDSRNALGRLGFFDGNTIEEKRVNNQTMDLIVKVKEAPTGNIQLGGGYGSYGGLLLSIAVNDRNIWGSGIDVGVRAERSSLSSNYSFSLSNARLNDSDFSGNLSIYTSDFQYRDYRVMSDGFNLGAGHRFTRYVSGHLGYGFSQNSYNFEENTSTYINKEYYQDYAKSSITASIRYDDTDDFYVPRKGTVLTQSIENAGVGADAKFIKSRTGFAVYKGLEEYVGFDLISRYKAKLNYVKDTGFLPIAEKFYMGGIGSVRGYQAFSLSPTTRKDSAATDGIRRYGGEYSATNSFELSFPLVPQAKMRLVTYLDWGYIGTTEKSYGDYIVQNLSRGGFGSGLEWFSPVGPIQLMFSRPIAHKPEDKTTLFEFTMGQRF